MIGFSFHSLRFSQNSLVPPFSRACLPPLGCASSRDRLAIVLPERSRPPARNPLAAPPAPLAILQPCRARKYRIFFGTAGCARGAPRSIKGVRGREQRSAGGPRGRSSSLRSTKKEGEELVRRLVIARGSRRSPRINIRDTRYDMKTFSPPSPRSSRSHRGPVARAALKFPNPPSTKHTLQYVTAQDSINLEFGDSCAREYEATRGADPGAGTGNHSRESSPFYSSLAHPSDAS